MRRKILLVDDDPDLVEFLRLTLWSAGYATVPAANGEEALQKVRRSRPDLIVLDLVLPGMNGLSVCEKLRSDPMTASIPIIMITGMPGAIARFAALEMGADAYVNKPFQVSELISAISTVLGLPAPAEVSDKAEPTAAIAA